MGSGLEELGIVDDIEEDPTAAPVQAASEGEDNKPKADDGAPASAAEDRAAELMRVLRQIALLEGLLPVHLRRIAGLAQEIHAKRGSAVFSHGDPGDGLYLILEGAVRISRHVSGIGEEALAVLQPGMYFGEMSIIDDDVPRSADAIAHAETRLLKLPKDDLRDLMFVDRELAYELLWRFVRTLSSRLRDSNDRLLMLTVSSKF